MSGLYEDIVGAFRKPQNGLIRLIIVNVAVFLLILVMQVTLVILGHSNYYVQFISNIKLSAALGTFAPKPWTLFTHFFAHEHIFHILFNMLFLYWFGGLIQEYIGSRRLVSLYVLGGLVGGLTFILLYNVFPYFHTHLTQPMLGASGATFAVVVGAATLLPNYTFFMLFLGPIRIKWIAAFYVLLSFAELTGSNAGGNIAHLGGALLGYAYIKLNNKGIDLGLPIEAIIDIIQRIFNPPPRRRPSMKVTYKSEQIGYYSRNTTRTEGEFPDEAEVDAILDKISKSGYESLTREEKQKLFKASQKS
jgi:membrane associated rhomboid family serine protease